ncbi:hypothetical protein Poly41_57160 [Novipirellula artificiosorum]|uniref:Uncharacterized protein n=1 Tax=Novipirellula artificiosorum TaxID=2528016 RepID=A0A5C6D8W4_9BACT|nr:hypothetical protein Poly41_57160 [Novipirellula artificiosorum]
MLLEDAFQFLIGLSPYGIKRINVEAGGNVKNYSVNLASAQVA